MRKIIILLSHSDETRLQQGIKELEAFGQRKVHATDPKALKRLDLFLAGRKDRDAFANNMWIAAGITSQDEEFLSTWFQLKLDQERWEAAQKVTNLLISRGNLQQTDKALSLLGGPGMAKGFPQEPDAVLFVDSQLPPCIHCTWNLRYE